MSDLQSMVEAIGVQALELQRWQDDGGRCVEQVNTQQCYELVNPALPGTVVTVGNYRCLWTVVGPTRHSYAVVVQEHDHGTTMHANISDLSVVEPVR